MIEKSHVLAEISQDLTGSWGQIYTSDVQAVAGSKKRKTSELALATDHQGAETSRIATSYAVSPQATFTCPPCSIRNRRQGVEEPRRYTYCSVASPKPRLFCFSETLAAQTISSNAIESTSIDLSHNAAPVSYLDTFQFHDEDHGSNDSKVIAVHEDGTTECFPKDLAAQQWSTNLIHHCQGQNSPSSMRVEHAAIVSVQQVRKAILKDRDDVLATLSARPEGNDGSLLLVIARSESTDRAGESGILTLRVFDIGSAKLASNAFPRSLKPIFQELASLIIPEAQNLRAKRSTYTFHTAFGTLYQSSGRSLALYDLTGFVPQLAQEMDFADNMASCLQLSPNLFACATSASVSVIGLPYCSLQAERNVKDLFQSSHMTQRPKRHREQPAQEDDLRLLSYFASLDVVVALQGQKLLAIQLSTTKSHDSGSRKRKRDGSLANAIGRGSTLATSVSSRGTPEGMVKRLGTYFSPSATPLDWRAKKAELDRYLSQSDVGNFERVAASSLGLETVQEGGYTLPSQSHLAIDPQKVHYLLSRIFSVAETHQPSSEPSVDAPRKLKVRFLPRKICDWLIEKGLFTTHYVQMALKHNGALPFTAKLATGALISALAESDISLEIISSMLANPVPLSSGELVHILAIITHDTESLGITGSQNLVTNGDLADSTNANKLQVINGTALQSSPPPSAALANVKSRQRILRLTLKRLSTCPSTSITRGLRCELSAPKLRLLVDALRMEIARSGWLSPYDDSTPNSDPNYQDNYKIGHIAHVLNCAIDSIGTAGWILGTSLADDLSETADTIAYMRAEISAALEGIEEVTYLKGMLGEMLLCGKNALRCSGKPLRLDQGRLANGVTRPMTITLGDEDSHILPLGLKTGTRIPKTKVGAGGELIQRSARDIGRLKSKSVGKYSFERIII